MRRLIGSWLWLFAVAAASPGEQPVTGRITDARTGKPIPYVNVGVPGAGEGTVGDDDGRFSLDVSRPDASILFSALGYESRAVLRTLLPLDGPVTLEPIDPGFQERVSVTAKEPGPPRILGYRNEEPGYKMGFGSGLVGAELGARIKVSGPTFVESAHFTIARTGGARLLYRVHLYDYSTGEIGRDLMTRNVIVEARQEVGMLSVDLREHGLVIERDVVLSLEWIRDDREMGNANIMFRAKPRSKSGVFIKPTSQMEFVEVPRHTLAFYLLGQVLRSTPGKS